MVTMMLLMNVMVATAYAADRYFSYFSNGYGIHCYYNEYYDHGGRGDNLVTVLIGCDIMTPNGSVWCSYEPPFGLNCGGNTY